MFTCKSFIGLAPAVTFTFPSVHCFLRFYLNEANVINKIILIRSTLLETIGQKAEFTVKRKSFKYSPYKSD